jgi:lauroyl/myristoyl acyltransferase
MRLMRAGEAILSPGLLRLLMLPLVAPLALRDIRLRDKLEAGWRHLGIVAPSKMELFRESLNFHLGRFITFWPDRLSWPRWRTRLEFQGLEAVRTLQAAGKPVVLVCLHHGPIHVLRYLLRAVGVPCTMVVLESRTERLPVREWKDSLSPPGGVPNVFCRDELKAMQQHMKAGGCLLVAADYGRGKMCELPFGPAKIQVASGAFRLAETVGATIFPVVVEETAAWQFRVTIGRGERPEAEAAEKVLAVLATKILATPALMHSQLADSLGPAGGGQMTGKTE